MVQVGKTQLRYHLRCLDDLHAMLAERGDWVPLGSADEQKPAAEGTVEAWARADDNPVGGWYGLKKGLRGRFANYVPAGAGGARAGRGRAQRPQQPHARASRPGADGRAAAAPAGDPFEALGDPNRRAIVELLGGGRRSVR